MLQWQFLCVFISVVFVLENHVVYFNYSFIFCKKNYKVEVLVSCLGKLVTEGGIFPTVQANLLQCLFSFKILCMP